MCGFQGTQKPYTISGDNGEMDPPVPIPNTEVKPFSADGTWLETTWESRTLPDSTKKSLRRCLGLFLCGSRQFLLPGRFQANVQHCTWLGSPMCAAGGGSSTWGNTWERAYSLVVLNERATNESRLLYKKEQHGYNSHRIVCIRSRDCAATHPLGQKRCGKGHTRLMKRYGDGRKSVPFPLYQVF